MLFFGIVVVSNRVFIVISVWSCGSYIPADLISQGQLMSPGFPEMSPNGSQVTKDAGYCIMYGHVEVYPRFSVFFTLQYALNMSERY